MSSNPFQLDAWLQATAAAVGGRAVDLSQAQLPSLIERRMGPFRVQGAPLPQSATPLSAALQGSNEQIHRQLEGLQDWFERDRPALLQVTSPIPPPPSCQPSRVETLDNLEIDLHLACEQLWSGLSELPRRMIRKAMRAGVRVRLRRPQGPALEAHRVRSEALFRAQKQAPIVRPQQYAALSDHRLQANLQFFEARLAGNSVGSLISWSEPGRSYYWDVAITPEARAHGVGHLLFWFWMRWCKRRGIPCLDMIGPLEGGRAGGRQGIGRFKASLGARPRRYFIIYWHTRLAGLALDLRRGWSRRRSQAADTG